MKESENVNLNSAPAKTATSQSRPYYNLESPESNPTENVNQEAKIPKTDYNP